MTDTYSPLREAAERAAGALPPLLVAAERLSSAVSLGVHGRRKAAWRELLAVPPLPERDPAQAIDWRQSAKSQNLYVREREWEAAEAVWFWCDVSAGMRFKSDAAPMTKRTAASCWGWRWLRC